MNHTIQKFNAVLLALLVVCGMALTVTNTRKAGAETQYCADYIGSNDCPPGHDRYGRRYLGVSCETEYNPTADTFACCRYDHYQVACVPWSGGQPVFHSYLVLLGRNYDKRCGSGGVCIAL